MGRVENTIPLLQCNCCLSMAWHIPLLHAQPSAWSLQKQHYSVIVYSRCLVTCDFTILALSKYATISYHMNSISVTLIQNLFVDMWEFAGVSSFLISLIHNIYMRKYCDHEKSVLECWWIYTLLAPRLWKSGFWNDVCQCGCTPHQHMNDWKDFIHTWYSRVYPS
jgi:hypothetical protein